MVGIISKNTREKEGRKKEFPDYGTNERTNELYKKVEQVEELEQQCVCMYVCMCVWDQ